MSQSIVMDQLEDRSFEGEFVSAVDDILQSCPRFRILVLGRSGVGKSHLINTVFGTDHTVVQHGRTPGISNINDEIVSEKNPRLVVHDSQGFSHGDTGNVQIVKQFIEERSQMSKLKDKIHAIWLCTEVPTFGSALLEKAEENILLLKDNIGVPIIAVLTKYDKLVDDLMQHENEDIFYGDIEDAMDIEDSADLDAMLNPSAVEYPPVDPVILSRADARLRDEFVPSAPLLKDVPWVGVSVLPNYASTLEELVKMTLANIDESVRLLWAVTQQQSADLKIDVSIKVAKKHYWRGLSTVFKLPGNSLALWLKVVHADIVQLWGLDDPDRVLPSITSTTTLSELQTDLFTGSSVTLKHISLSTATTAASIISAIIPPAAPVAIPVAAGLIFAIWVYDAVSMTPDVLRGMMGYIVDLTVVMQSLFFLIQARKDASKSTVITERFFTLALRAYTHHHDQQHLQSQVHNEIRTFATRSMALHSEQVIHEVERLIRLHRFKPSDVFVKEARENLAISGTP